MTVDEKDNNWADLRVETKAVETASKWVVMWVVM